MTIRQSARRIRIAGRVQGVGFRPYVYRLADQHHLTGSVCNQMGQVEIIIQGLIPQLEHFENSLIEQSPQIAEPEIVSRETVALTDRCCFEILASVSKGPRSIHVPPDFFSCPDCLAELHDPHDRRYGYPFINCTQCGPRYTLIQALPYDRPNTSMAGFELCEACRKEYTDPLDRRFHAEPIACPVCGPALSFELDGDIEDDQRPPLQQAITDLHNGRVVAVKGIGGYHLMCDAYNQQAVVRLRQRKHRPHKPLAVMFAMATRRQESDLARAVVVSGDAWHRLSQPDRPIILLPKQRGSELADAIAPGLNKLGVMLAYSPLHDLLLSEFGGPLVATSGNLSGEPVITGNTMASRRLKGIADSFLHHNRPILRPADDAVLHYIGKRVRTLRPGRGQAPLELSLPHRLNEPVLALGGQMKAVVALAWDHRIVISPHIGEMQSPRSLAVFEQLLEDLQALYEVQAKHLICDAHPDYASHRWARKQNLPVHRIWHHHAHASSLMLESTVMQGGQSTMLVFSWDGVGWGPDQTLWGGEALLGFPGDWQRYAHWRPFHVPGGDKAGREPWRSAAALCWSLGIDFPRLEGVPEQSLDLLKKAWQEKLNAPQTTAVGRLFDAASALLGLAGQASFEGQGPMYLETLAEHHSGRYIDVPLQAAPKNACLQMDWAPLVRHMLNRALSPGQRAADWHESMASAILAVSLQARADHGVDHIGFCGGVFQNQLLSERAIILLEQQGFECSYPETITVNDGGLCVGQVVEYLYRKS